VRESAVAADWQAIGYTYQRDCEWQANEPAETRSVLKMSNETRRCEWCGDISQGACDCPANAQIERLHAAYGHSQQQFVDAAAEIERLRGALERVARWHGEFINMKRATWVMSDDAVTCPKCRALIDSRGMTPNGPS
jgi:hypothetical protein